MRHIVNLALYSLSSISLLKVGCVSLLSLSLSLSTLSLSLSLSLSQVLVFKLWASKFKRMAADSMMKTRAKALKRKEREKKE